MFVSVCVVVFFGYCACRGVCVCMFICWFV